MGSIDQEDLKEVIEGYEKV
jgi:hypothetical protein